MIIKFKEKTFYIFWIVSLIISVYFVTGNFSGFPRETLPVQYWSNLIQRISALFLLLLLPIQLYIGSFNSNLQEKYGYWIKRIHINQGKLIYSLVIIHILSFLVFNYFFFGRFDPFYVFTDFCLICPEKRELYISLGRFSFYAITVTAMAAALRDSKFLTKDWKYLHKLNYLIFILIFPHAYFTGSDIRYTGFIYIFYILVVIVSYIWLRKIFDLLKRFRLK